MVGEILATPWNPRILETSPQCYSCDIITAVPGLLSILVLADLQRANTRKKIIISSFTSLTSVASNNVNA